MIRGIIDATGVKIDVDDSGTSECSVERCGRFVSRAIQMISDLTAVPEVGKTYLGKVVRIAEFGCLCRDLPWNGRACCTSPRSRSIA